VRWWLQDSCSSDDSVAIARRYLTPADHIELEPDKGQADGLNRAMARMGGDIIGFLNSDDCLADGAAEAVLEVFRLNPDVDIVYGEVEWIDEQGQSAGFHKGEISSLSEILDIYDVWWNKRNWVQPEVFWRRSLWDRVGPFNDEFDLAFDYEYWVRCFIQGVRVRRLPHVLAKFRRHSQQKSTASLKAASEIRTILSRNLNGCASLDSRYRYRLQKLLSYDYYQTAQLGFPRRPFWRALLSRPDWLMLPEVRRRLYIAGKGRIFPSSRPIV
jgi:glycosyltransferase involved in cell wall biosynthesis